MTPERSPDELQTADSRNLLDALHPEGQPPYVLLAREYRKELRKSVEEEGWPEVPEVTGGDAFFKALEQAVNDRWEQHTYARFHVQVTAWANALPSEQKYDSLRTLLRDPKEVQMKLMIQQLGSLEDLREPLPEAWRTLLLLSSERQLAIVQLLHRWANQLAEDEQRGHTFAEATGIKPTELQLLARIAGLNGKFADHAYLKQEELIDRKDAVQKTPEADEPGGKYFYYMKGEAGTTKQTIAETYPYEIPHLAGHCQRIAEEVRTAVTEGKLPETYAKLPDYLALLATTYLSDEKDAAKIREANETVLRRALAELATSGCPIMIIPHAVGGRKGRVEMEMRVGYRTQETEQMQSQIHACHQIGAAFVEEHKAAFAEPYVLPPAFVNLQPFCFGVGDYWAVRGQAGRQIILSHSNAIEAVARQKQLPLARAMLTNTIDNEAYVKAAVFDVANHEIAHATSPRLDSNIGRRVDPNANDATILEELKAETLSIFLAKTAHKKGDVPRDVVEMFIAIRIADSADYIRSKSSEKGTTGERYFYPGLKILHTLLECGALVRDGEKYRIADAQKGIEALAAIGENIPRQFHFNEQATMADVSAFSDEVRQLLDDGETKKFVEWLRALKV